MQNIGRAELEVSSFIISLLDYYHQPFDTETWAGHLGGFVEKKWEMTEFFPRAPMKGRRERELVLIPGIYDTDFLPICKCGRIYGPEFDEWD